MENLLIGLSVFAVLTAVLSTAAIVFTLVYMHYYSKYANKKLSVLWYVFAVLFGGITLIVFLIEKKSFPGPDTKVCNQCGDRFASAFQICPKCLIELPVNNAVQKLKYKKISKISGIAVIITYVLSLIAGIILGAFMSDYITEYEYGDVHNRIAVNDVFYDKKGIAYENEDDVLLYDEEGRIYSLISEADEDEPFYEEYYYVRDDGEKYFLYDCYVSEDGWFFCDKAMQLVPYEEDTSSMTEEELDEYYNSLLESDYGYRYYDYPSVDKNGTLYYYAYEASWNSYGELITAENDTTR